MGPVAIACAHYLNFVVMLLVIVVGTWPVPYRARWTPQGLDVWWLFVRERLGVADIESARLRTKVRFLFFIRYELALELELGGGRRAVIVGPQELLETLHRNFTVALASLGRGDADDNQPGPPNAV